MDCIHVSSSRCPPLQLCEVDSNVKTGWYPRCYLFSCDSVDFAPLTSVEAERMFSQLKIIKTKLRTKMTQAFLNSLVRIRYNGPPSSEYFAEYSSEIINHWRNLKGNGRVIFK